MAPKVWAVLQHRDGKLHRMSWETIAAAQQLAAKIGGAAEALLLGGGVDALAKEAAASELAGVRVADHPVLAGYTPGAYVAVLAAAIAAERPAFVLFPHSYQSAEYVPRLAQATASALVPE